MKSTLSLCGIVAAAIACIPASFADEGTVALDAKQTKPLQAGAAIPDLTLKDAEGNEVKLSSLHRDGPLVLVFFRGGWCPICTKHTGALIEVHPQVKELGAQLVGVSPDNKESSKDNVTKNAIPFPILSDADVAAAKAFGLAFRVDDETVKKYQGFGIDLEKASGQKHHVLPVPAVFIVDRSGKIAFAHSDPDYRQRLDVERIVSELRKLK